MKTKARGIFAEIEDALTDYSRELVDILDHITGEEEIASYGKKSEDLEDLIARWRLNITHSPVTQYTKISIHNSYTTLQEDEELVHRYS